MTRSCCRRTTARCGTRSGSPGRSWHEPAAPRRAVGENALPTIRLRDLRHTHATSLLRAGVHPQVVQERLGHANISITLDVYSHVIPSMQRDAADLFAQAVHGR